MDIVKLIIENLTAIAVLYIFGHKSVQAVVDIICMFYKMYIDYKTAVKEK